MRGLFVVAIAGVFSAVVAVSIVYCWGANASCWEANGTQYANANAGSLGLHDGNLRVLAKVDLAQANEQANFMNQFVHISAHASGDIDDPALAKSAVNGLDANNVPQAEVVQANG
ncbi:MAG: hypothetical protein OXN17_13410 [Candidatus Poribacteria bacterium]|nr:hypothetical protein [Candidatus Poribacteria bacterium]